jgi:transcriptional regulator with XRE-family HTH domain
VLRSSDIGALCVNHYTDVKSHVTRTGWNHSRMSRDVVPPAYRYARNLKILLELHGMTVAEVAKKANVIPKQVYNLLNVSHDPRVKGLEKVANAFGLTTWQMLAFDMTDRPAENRQILELLESFAMADESGRATILRVAEIASQTIQKAG